jgi:hypothetical protein
MRRILARCALLGAAVTMLTAGDAIRRDELACEEAYAKIEHCCGVRPTQLSCDYVAGCGTPPNLPDVSEPLSARLLRLDCDELVSEGWCTRDGDRQ